MSCSQSENLERLRKTLTGRRVTVDANRPELYRWANMAGRVVTVNCNGRALVRFDGPDRAWHDIAPEFLRLSDDGRAAVPVSVDNKQQNTFSKPE